MLKALRVFGVAARVIGQGEVGSNAGQIGGAKASVTREMLLV